MIHAISGRSWPCCLPSGLGTPPDSQTHRGTSAGRILPGGHVDVSLQYEGPRPAGEEDSVRLEDGESESYLCGAEWPPPPPPPTE